MNCRTIIEELEKRYPVCAAEAWDNPGLLAGKSDREVKKVYVTLDVTNEAVREAVEWGADLVLSHHPMIFSAMKQINDGGFIGKKVIELLEHHISYYAMHTNFDVCKMAEINASLLGLTDCKPLEVTNPEKPEEGIGRVGNLPQEMTLQQLAEAVKEAYQLPWVKVCGDLTAPVTRAAVCGGSGKSMTADAIRQGAQVYITGDIDHHTALDALDQGLFFIDAGHYGTEYFFMEQLRRDCAQIDETLQVRCAKIRLPFTHI